MGSFIMGFIESMCEANKALQYVFNFLPSYALGKGLVNVRAVLTLACMVSWRAFTWKRDCRHASGMMRWGDYTVLRWTFFFSSEIES